MKTSGAPVASVEAGGGECVGEQQSRIARAVIARFSLPTLRWNSSGIGGFQIRLPHVVGGHERDGAVGAADAGG